MQRQQQACRPTASVTVVSQEVAALADTLPASRSLPMNTGLSSGNTLWHMLQQLLDLVISNTSTIDGGPGLGHSSCWLEQTKQGCGIVIVTVCQVWHLVPEAHWLAQGHRNLLRLARNKVLFKFLGAAEQFEPVKSR